MKYLGKRDLIKINHKTIEQHGGNFSHPDNILNVEPLDYLVEIINARAFGEELYKEIHEKAGLYMFNIISNHIFSDGNKRTGLEAAILFLDLNGFRLDRNLRHDDVISFTINVASGQVDLIECQTWFSENIIQNIP